MSQISFRIILRSRVLMEPQAPGESRYWKKWEIEGVKGSWSSKHMSGSVWNLLEHGYIIGLVWTGVWNNACLESCSAYSISAHFHNFIPVYWSAQILCLSVHPSIQLSICLSVCLSFSLSVNLSESKSVLLSISLSAYLSMSAYPSVCLPACLSVCMSTYLSVGMPFCLPTYLSGYLYVCLSICLFICLSICLPFWLYACV